MVNEGKNDSLFALFFFYMSTSRDQLSWDGRPIVQEPFDYKSH